MVNSETDNIQQNSTVAMDENDGRKVHAHLPAVRPGHDQGAEQQHHEDDGGEPELLPLAHEIPQVFKKIDHQKGLSKFFAGALALTIR